MKKIIFIIMILFITIIIYNDTKQELYIPDTSIRLRIIPNSNKAYDIKMKEEVKKILEKDLIKDLKNIKDINEAREVIKNNISYIDSNIEELFKENNYKKIYNINFGLNYFPKKEYLNKTYKEGLYESIVISIGDAKGDNWWCALFPNFCLLDLEEDKEYESYIHNLLNELF